MSYGEAVQSGGRMEARLCLDDEMAKPFMSHKIGDKVTLQVEAVLVSAEMRPDYESSMPGDNKKQPPKKPRCEFVIAKVNGKEDSSDYKGMSSEDFEKKVAKNRGY